MKRREFLLGAASASATVIMGAHGRAEEPADARLIVEYDRPGRAIARDFLGLSYESALLASPDYLSLDNRSVLGLMRALGRNGVLRIGGNTSERTLWQQTSGGSAAADRYVITPQAIDRLAAMLRVLDWRLVYGLNLARGTPESAAAEAAYVARATGKHLLAFQIGNEPDGFGRWSGVRPKNYDVTAFLAEWRRFCDDIRSAVPSAPFAGPDVAAETGWIPRFAQAARKGLVLLTRHYYADGPASDPAVTLARLLRSAPNFGAVLRDLRSYGKDAHLPFRIAEANSVYAGGRRGVSDTLGAALWGLEAMFQIAEGGGIGINFHGGDDKVYTPIGPSKEGRHRAMPLYYAMLMFARAGRGMLVPVRLEAPEMNFTAYATRGSDDTLRVCLIIKDITRGARVGVDTGKVFKASSVLRLAGPAIDASDGVTLGNAEVDEFGRWSPNSRETARLKGRAATIAVPAASAALVTYVA